MVVSAVLDKWAVLAGRCLPAQSIISKLEEVLEHSGKRLRAVETFTSLVPDSTSTTHYAM